MNRVPLRSEPGPIPAPPIRLLDGLFLEERRRFDGQLLLLLADILDLSDCCAQADQESNPDTRIWNPLRYRYATDPLGLARGIEPPTRSLQDYRSAN